MSKQDQKYGMGISGEFFVAAQLWRRGLLASVVYANAKRADVIAFSNNEIGRHVTIEVKSTDKTKWKVSNTLPEPSPKPWVFVNLPSDKEAFPSFYILTQKEIHDICRPAHIAYGEKYKLKHGKIFDEKSGFLSITLKQVENHKDKWEKILRLFNVTSGV